MIKRYVMLGKQDWSLEEVDGNWVKYEDHLAEISALRLKLEAAEKIPMKYRRMEFNAQLQKENSELRKQLEAAEKDVQRMDWIIDNYTGNGGGNGFEVRVWIPVDTECVRHGIDEALRTLQKDGK